jgi:signal transduction histidine kinase
VHIESVVADHHEYRVQKPLRIPPLTRTLEIDYTALSMAVPQRVRFRYRLEGHDADWQDVGTRRQAYYNDIPPGRYRFRVIACNSSGVWNEVGDVIELDLAPAWFQTLWFRLFMVALGVAIVAVFYRIRIRQVSAIFNVRLEERARLSRDIHDSLLQTVQGSKLLADNALAQTGDGDPLRPTLARLSDWLGQAIREGRDSLNAMRASAATPENLSVRIRRLFESLQAPEAMQLTLDVRGLEPPMQAKAQEQVYVIVQEAIRNAYQHSKGARIAVDAECIADLRIQVRDDGVGFDPSAQSADRLNHFGLKSMVERATQIGGKLEIQSSVGNGTIITLTVPGGALFNKRENIFAALIRRIPEWHRSTQ